MDRRQQKSRKAIFEAFSLLLEKKRYSKITVQDIIDTANVGRSTFYAHFETKDELLNAICEEIFDHIFESLHTDDSCTLKDRNSALSSKLSHLLWHLREQKNKISAFLIDENSELFLRYFKQHLTILFADFSNSANKSIPKAFVTNHYVTSFAETVKWWSSNRMSLPPEVVVEYYMQLIR